MTKIRTRFAPSPTGWMHIGNLRTALFAYLIAKKNDDGTFVLRIEDTDKNREVIGSLEFIFDTLKASNLQHDEGPDVGGAYGPYVQSQRVANGVYSKYAHDLVESGHAFYCFCNKKEDDENAEEESENDENVSRETFSEKNKFIKQNDSCKNIPLSDAKARIANGEKFVIKQVIPSGTTAFDDAVFGKITVDNKTLDEQILVKSDGYPTYNFANVIDDHLMEISHVVRGSEYLSSTPKYNILYDALGWTPPTYVHVPQIMKDHSHKLSKRNGDASFQDLIGKGFLPEAIINYIALLGWHPADEREIFSLDDLKREFSIDRISKSEAIFDPLKLRWMNGIYIRELPIEKFHEFALPFYEKCITKKLDLTEISKLLHQRIETFGDIPDMVDFFNALPDYGNDLFIHKKMKTDAELSAKVLPVITEELEKLSDWNPEKIHKIFMDLVAKLEMKNGQVFWPARVALSGKEFTPGGPVEIAAIIGKDETISRLKNGIRKLQQ